MNLFKPVFYRTRYGDDMRSWLKNTAFFLINSIAGAIGLSFLTMLLHWLFVPVFLEYWLAPIVTIPTGAVLGAMTGSIIISPRRKGDRHLGVFSIVSALVAVVWIILTVAPFKFSQESIFYFGGLPLLWSICLLIYGFKALISSR